MNNESRTLFSSVTDSPVRATIRLQFRQGFTLDDATELVPYFAELGISHIYASPLFRSRPGSTHGYDILDYGSIEPDLGGEGALRRLVTALRAHRMGLIIDIVPNHMAVGGAGNIWWENVLAWGENSLYARFFDISWKAYEPERHGRVVLPFLDRPYGEALASGVLKLKNDPETGLFFVFHHQHRFPVCPAHYGSLLKQVAAPPELCAAFCAVTERMMPDGDVDGALAGLSGWSRTPEGQENLNRLMSLHNPETSEGRKKLHTLICRQNWRAIWWRTANEVINWRRFFDNTELGAIAAERMEVFEATHDYVISLFAHGLIDGVRVDHIDGLTAPAVYCHRLRDCFLQVAPFRPAEAGNRISIYVEKILGATERLPVEWCVDGTTGYDFMDQVSAVLHDENGKTVLNELWEECSGDNTDMAAIELTARNEILPGLFAAEFSRLISCLKEALLVEEGRERDDGCSIHDDTDFAIADVMRAVFRHFVPYRTYYADGMVLDHRTDLASLNDAAKKSRPDLLPSRYGLLDRIVALLASYPENMPSIMIREAQRAFEHLTAPLSAKSLEDTGFYRYVRLISRNEVGSDPGILARTVSDFHTACTVRLRNYPRAMLATATHDHKRGEDSRMRIAVISETAEEWRGCVQRWLTKLAGRAGPDRIDALMLYQTLLSVWPSDGRPERLVSRVSEWLTKALREGKRHTNWLDPDEAYEAACQDYLAMLLDSQRSSVFLAEMTAFSERIAPAAALNGLSQTLLRLTTPGVPDLYQGSELWDFSLVDPDNRRPVDFSRREALLRNETDFDQAATEWKNGAVKLLLIRLLLQCRARHPLLFTCGSYEPVAATDDHLIVFHRSYENTQLLVVAPRHTLLLGPDGKNLRPEKMPEPVRFPDSCHKSWRSVIRPARRLQIGTEAVQFFEPGLVPVECFIAEA